MFDIRTEREDLKKPDTCADWQARFSLCNADYNETVVIPFTLFNLRESDDDTILLDVELSTYGVAAVAECLSKIGIHKSYANARLAYSDDCIIRFSEMKSFTFESSLKKFGQLGSICVNFGKAERIRK